MSSPEELQRLHQVLIFVLLLCPIGVIRTYFFLRTDKGRLLPLPFKAFSLAMPLVAAGILLLLW
jgi:hypothetical protein